jgi:hypothetical protein
LALLVFGSSCINYRHQHVNLDGSKEITTFGAFIYVGSASKIRSAVKTEGYSRTVSVGELSGKGDEALIQAITSGIVQGLKAGAVP